MTNRSPRTDKDVYSIVAQGLLFDMDGTLVDSAASIDAVWLDFADRHGIDHDTVRAALPGRTARAIIESVVPETVDVAAEVDWIRAHEIDSVLGVGPIAGAARMLASLPPACWTVVTSASRAMMVKRLTLAGLPLPRSSVCAEDVSAGKPDPEGFLAGAQLLGIDISGCVVFEDSVSGLVAAERAGAVSVSIGTPYSDAHLIADFTEIMVRHNRSALTVEFHR